MPQIVNMSAEWMDSMSEPTCFDHCGTVATWIHIPTGYVFCKSCSIENGRGTSKSWMPYPSTPEMQLAAAFGEYLDYPGVENN
jgi:hypothetical protein